MYFFLNFFLRAAPSNIERVIPGILKWRQVCMISIFCQKSVIAFNWRTIYQSKCPIASHLWMNGLLEKSLCSVAAFLFFPQQTPKPGSVKAIISIIMHLNWATTNIKFWLKQVQKACTTPSPCWPLFYFVFWLIFSFLCTNCKIWYWLFNNIFNLWAVAMAGSRKNVQFLVQVSNSVPVSIILLMLTCKQ